MDMYIPLLTSSGLEVFPLSQYILFISAKYLFSTCSIERLWCFVMLFGRYSTNCYNYCHDWSMWHQETPSRHGAIRPQPSAWCWLSTRQLSLISADTPIKIPQVSLFLLVGGAHGMRVFLSFCRCRYFSEGKKQNRIINWASSTDPVSFGSH